MKSFILLCLTILLFACSKKADEKKNDLDNIPRVDNTAIAFRRGDSIYLRTKDGNENLIGAGYFPCISPDGKRLTYTKYGTDARQVYLLDLQTKQEVKLNVASDNFYDAIWSPNGKFIAFSIMGETNWEVGVIKSDNTGFRTIKARPGYGLSAPTWTGDSKSIVAQDGYELVEFNIEGSVIRQFDIQESVGDSCYVSGSNRFWLTSDRSGIFFNSGVNEGMEGVEGPVEAISYFDISTKKLKRISPSGLHCTDLFMLSDNKIVFIGSKVRQDQSDIYIYDLSKDTLDLFAQNGREPSGVRVD
jgi:TolB protein